MTNLSMDIPAELAERLTTLSAGPAAARPT
jgi:hypothetical protein